MSLENARLYRMAQDGNRIKDQFLATLSHELRTPLTAILGWSRMLTLGGLDRETMQTAYGTIERAARNQAALIDDLLDLSRVVTGKLSLRSEPVDLSAVIDGALETLGLAADSKGIRLHPATHDDRAIVTGDATRLQQIAWNLLSNAIKFSDAGGSVSRGRAAPRTSRRGSSCGMRDAASPPNSCRTCSILSVRLTERSRARRRSDSVSPS